MRARQRLAVGSSTPATSKRTVPGFTTAHQNSGSPLPLPMRTSRGLDETDLCGKIRMNNRPSRRRKWLAATRPASIWRAVTQAGLSACRPYSPNATVLPRVAFPLIFPRWLLRNFTRLGIKGMGHQSLSYSQNYSPQRRRGRGENHFDFDPIHTRFSDCKYFFSSTSPRSPRLRGEPDFYRLPRR